MQENQTKPSRRGFFFGAAITGAAAVTLSALPGAPVLDVPADLPKPAPEKGGGYSVSDRVKQYYQTARL